MRLQHRADSKDRSGFEERSDLGEPVTATLQRVLSFPLVVLYGLGITVGAGIYVLIGETAARAGALAPLAFLLSALVMVPPAFSFSELAGRYPFAAGAAQYVEEGLKSRILGLAVGLAVICSGLVTAATISSGAAGYLGTMVPLPQWLLICIVVLAMGMIAGWGIRASVLFASAMTICEVGGLLMIILGAIISDPAILARLPELVPSVVDRAALGGILQASLLAFFAFIGFEDIANIAEEIKEPRRTIPRAILGTLLASTMLYVLLIVVAVLTVGPFSMAGQSAPLSFLFTTVTGLPAGSISIIAVMATLNGVIVQIIMISRLAYGLSSRKLAPQFLSRVNPRTRTPLVATTLASLMILGLSLTLHIVVLAEWTSRIILLVFAAVCLSLFVIKIRGDHAPEGAFQNPTWLPAAGFVACAGLLGLDLFFG
jgi:amino acid transporter